MESYLIEGGVPLRGEYRIKGAKNSALPVIAATLCRPAVYEIYDCPHIGDVFVMEKIIKGLGAVTKWEDDCLIVDSRGINQCVVDRELMSVMRSSVFLLGSLLARCGEATVYRPGGCRIGNRPIDIHIDGLERLGFEVDVEDDKVSCKGFGRGGHIVLPYPSVGATENLMMAALSARGDTIIENCAAEPEIVDLQGFLRTCGFQVYGAGTDTVFVKGTGSENSKTNYFLLREGNASSQTNFMYFIIEDRIEAATYMMATAATGGKTVFRNIRPEFCREVLKTLERMGVLVKYFDDIIEISAPRTLKSPGMIVTEPYPGFPTDCQPQLLTLATRAKGLTTIREEIFESRFTHKKALINMGANIEICGKNAIIKGVNKLTGCETYAADLRGGAALVIAGLMAEGITVVNDIQHIERGYQELDKGIRTLGGLIEKRKNEA